MASALLIAVTLPPPRHQLILQLTLPLTLPLTLLQTLLVLLSNLPLLRHQSLLGIPPAPQLRNRPPLRNPPRLRNRPPLKNPPQLRIPPLLRQSEKLQKIHLQQQKTPTSA